MNESMADALASAVRSAGGEEWRRAKRREDRISSESLDRIRYETKHETIRRLAFKVMEQAYLKASAGGRYPANARQIYYAARPSIIAGMQGTIFEKSGVDSQYFTQTLLKDYLEYYKPSWDVVYDARGHFAEPHTGHKIGIGGLEVRGYVAGFTDGQFEELPHLSLPVCVATMGPRLRYGGILFIEKEGFGPLLAAAQIAERFDVAIASTKGMPTAAMCDLLHALEKHDLTAYVVHDFDKSGFSIVHTLEEGARGSRGTGLIVDLGFRLEDIEGLERERVHYKQDADPRENLSENGATEEEIEVLVQGGGESSRFHYYGERVELNAMMADQFVGWLCRKFTEHGIGKIIPAEDLLEKAFRRAWFLQEVETAAERLRARRHKGVVVPASLAKRVTRVLGRRPKLTWDEAVWELAKKGRGGGDSGKYRT
jgi:hypothetical protein